MNELALFYSCFVVEITDVSQQSIFFCKGSALELHTNYIGSATLYNTTLVIFSVIVRV
jgi:hypothetical protein